MDYKPIRKTGINEMAVKPNLLDYERARQEFGWEDINKELDWFDDGGINIAYEVIDRHVKTPLRDKIALFWEGKNGESETYTFHDLSKLSNRFAGALRNLDIKKGDRILLFTDGVIETKNKEKELYGSKRLEQFILSNNSQPVELFNRALLTELDRFKEDPFDDDVLIVSVKIK